VTPDRVVTKQRWRWPRRWAACLLGLITCGSLGLFVLLHALDQPWVKRRLQLWVRTSAGVEVDYRAAQIAILSGASVEGLVVRSPAQVGRFARDLLRIDRVKAQWSLATLLSGRRPVFERVIASQVALFCVVDEHGRTSFDALSEAGPTSAPEPAVPLSQLARLWLGTAPPLRQLAVDHITLTLIRTAHGQAFDRWELQGGAIALAASALEPAKPGWLASAGLGSPAKPLALLLSRAVPGAATSAARAQLWLTLEATSSALHAAIDVRMLEQSFATRVSARHWLHAQASALFDPAAARTEISIDHAQAGDAAAVAQVSLEIPDAGYPIVQRADGELDLAQLLGWLPAGLIPVSAEHARARWHIDSLRLGPVVRLSKGSAVSLDANLANVTWGAPGTRLGLGTGELSLRATPTPNAGIDAQGALHLTGLRLAANAGELVANDVALDVNGAQAADGAVEGHASADFTRVEHTAAASSPRDHRTSLAARDGHIELHVHALHANAAEPLSTRADVGVSAKLGTLELRSPTQERVLAEGLTLRAHTALSGHPPYVAEFDAQAVRLAATGADGRALTNASAKLAIAARDVQPDVTDPTASRGVVHATLHLGELRASVDATKTRDQLAYAARLTANSLQVLRPFLSPALRDAADWDRMALRVRSSGRMEQLRAAAPALRTTTDIELQRPVFGEVAADSLSLTVKSQGNALLPQLDLDLRTEGLAIAGGAARDDHLALSASLNRQRTSLEFQLAAEGRATANVAAALAFDASKRGLSYRIDGDIADLGPLAPLTAKSRALAGFDLSLLKAALSARGTLFGCVAAVEHDGTITFEPNPLRTAMLEGTAELRVAHFRWAKAATAIAAPLLVWHGVMHAQGERRTLDSRVDAGTLRLAFANKELELNGIEDETSAVILGNLANPDIELSQRLAVRAVEQAVVPEYPLGKLSIALSAERNPEGVVHISQLTAANGAAGTELAVSGNFDASEGHRTLSVTTSLAQDLTLISTIPERFKGRGKLTVEANVTSPDLALYRIRATVKADNVSVKLSRAGVELESANGEVPIMLELGLGGAGVHFERSDKRNPYSMLRFADQHPLLTRNGFLSIQRLKTPFVAIAPLVGNLAIDQNVVSLSQFEMGVRGGSITGQCGLDWEGPNSSIELHVRASGVQSTHGEPFDGNIAVAISAADRTIDGRAEILRIGERHLLDLLDLQDPLHVDSALNRIRSALDFGYPDSMRLVFDHGFASAHLELGGLARLVSIGELRGIPMGPIVDKLLAPILDGLDTKEAP
jgi:translocation and assembly module TamB